MKYRVLFQIEQTFDGEMTVDAESETEAQRLLDKAFSDGVIFKMKQNGKAVVDPQPSRAELFFSDTEVV